MKNFDLVVIKSLLFILVFSSSQIASAQWNGTQTNSNVAIGTTINSSRQLHVKRSGSSSTNNRAAYLDGTTEIKGDFLIGNNQGKFVFYCPFQSGQDYLDITPNQGGLSNSYRFNRSLRFFDSGELEKKIDSGTARALSVSLNGTRNFQVMGDGTIYARDIEVTLTNFPDYVFARDYNLLPLTQLEKYIDENSHLPNIPSAKTVEEEGMSLATLAKLELEKIEELTLYIIELNKKVNSLEKELAEVKSR